MTPRRQQSLRNPRFSVRFVIELDDKPVRDLLNIDIDVILDRDIHLGCATADVPAEAGQAINGLAQRVQSGDRDRQ